MKTTFTIPWRSKQKSGPELPLLDLALRAASGRFVPRTLLIDSGAEISMGSRALCSALGFDWEKGTPVKLEGISRRPECVVTGSILPVDIFFREAGCRFTIPFCFAEFDAPLLLGRDVFFEAFAIEFEMKERITRFRLSAASA